MQNCQKELKETEDGDYFFLELIFPFTFFLFDTNQYVMKFFLLQEQINTSNFKPPAVEVNCSLL